MLTGGGGWEYNIRKHIFFCKNIFEIYFVIFYLNDQDDPRDNKDCMELEQRAEDVTETQTCTNEVSEVTKVTKPNKLLFRKPHFNWLRNGNQLIPG